MNFNEIVKLVKLDYEIDYKGMYPEDILTYISLKLVYLGYANRYISKDEASNLKDRIHKNYRNLSNEHNNHIAQCSQHQDFITRAREYRGQLNKGFGNKSDSELLELAVKCISAMCCDKMMMNRFYEKHKI